ncbi:hypothetical protein RB195_008775 [Necator americanus]|uniref:Uncharacterized protein n=1 Tax=Necator americanus TaxID=51031 RepID=A0ABR1CS35_NECAM
MRSQKAVSHTFFWIITDFPRYDVHIRQELTFTLFEIAKPAPRRRMTDHGKRRLTASQIEERKNLAFLEAIRKVRRLLTFLNTSP